MSVEIINVILLGLYGVFFIAAILLAVPREYDRKKDDAHIVVLVLVGFVLVMSGFVKLLNEFF